MTSVIKRSARMFRIRHQLFFAGLMVATAAVYSALVPISFGQALKRRAQRFFKRTRPN